MERFTRFDRDVLAFFVQHMPYENILHFTALLLAESAVPVGRDALNASLARLCAARLLVCEGAEICASDEVKLAARGRFWNAEGWKDRLFEAAFAEEDARGEAPAPQQAGAARPAGEYVGAEPFEQAQRYARRAKKLSGEVSPARRRGLVAAAVLFSLLFLAAAAVTACIALFSAIEGDHDGTFAAVGSFLFLPAALWCFACALSVRKAEQGGFSARCRRALFAASMLSSLAHAAFFAALIPQAVHHAAGLALVLAAAGGAAAAYAYKRRPPAVRAARIRKKLYHARVFALTRCARFWLGGADVLSDEHRKPAAGASADMYAFGRRLEAKMYAVCGENTFHVALAEHRGISVIGLPRFADLAAARAGEESEREDEKKNAVLEVALLKEYAARERAQAGREALSWSEDGLIGGFVCLQDGLYCAKCSAPFFRAPYDPEQPEGAGDVFAFSPAPDGPSEEEVSWEPVIEESFRTREHAEAFLRLVLAEADAEELYATLAE